MARVEGLRQLNRTLDRLEKKVAKKATRAGIGAAMTPVAKAVRSGINSTPASAELKRGMRKSVGKRFTKKAGARVGFAVAKKRGTRFTKHESRGVGLGQNNVHWFVLGTKGRTASGHSTGRVPAIFDGVIERAFRSSQSAALQAARVKVEQVIHREASKR